MGPNTRRSVHHLPSHMTMVPSTVPAGGPSRPYSPGPGARATPGRASVPQRIPGSVGNVSRDYQRVLDTLQVRSGFHCFSWGHGLLVGQACWPGLMRTRLGTPTACADIYVSPYSQHLQSLTPAEVDRLEAVVRAQAVGAQGGQMPPGGPVIGGGAGVGMGPGGSSGAGLASTAPMRR